MSGATRIEARDASHAIQLLCQALAKREIGYVMTNGRSIECKKGAAKFSLSILPGNKRTLVSHGVEVELESRGKGLGREALLLREECAREAGVTLILATVRSDNFAEMALLVKNNWKRFTAREDTGVSLWAKELIYA